MAVETTELGNGETLETEYKKFKDGKRKVQETLYRDGKPVRSTRFTYSRGKLQKKFITDYRFNSEGERINKQSARRLESRKRKVVVDGKELTYRAPKTYIVNNETTARFQTPTAYRSPQASLNGDPYTVAYLPSGGVRVFQNGKEVPFKEARQNLTKEQLAQIASGQREAEINRQRSRGIFYKSEAAKRISFEILEARRRGFISPKSALVTTPAQKADVLNVAAASSVYLMSKEVLYNEYAKPDAIRGTSGKYYNIFPSDRFLLSATPPVLLAGEFAAQQRTRKALMFTSSITQPYLSMEQRERQVRQSLRGGSFALGLVTQPIKIGMDIYAGGKSFVSKNYNPTALKQDIRASWGGLLYSTIRKDNTGAPLLKYGFTEKLYTYSKTKPNQQPLTEQEFIFGAAVATVPLTLSPAGAALLGLAGGFGFGYSGAAASSSFKAGDRTKAGEEAAEAVLGLFAYKTGIRPKFPKVGERLYSFIDPKYKPTITDSETGFQSVPGIKRTQKVKTGEIEVSGYERIYIGKYTSESDIPSNWVWKTDTLYGRIINVKPYRRGVYSKELTLDLVPEGKNLGRPPAGDPYNQQARGGFGWPFRQQALYAGVTGDVASAQRGLFSFFRRRADIGLGKGGVLDDSFFGTPPQLKPTTEGELVVGNPALRRSRLFTEEASLKEFFEGKAEIGNSPKPQALVFEQAKISEIPKELQPLATRAARGNRAAEVKFGELYKKYQATPKDDFTPFGYTPSSELEVTRAAPGSVIRGERLATTFINGKRVSIYSPSFKKPPTVDAGTGSPKTSSSFLQNKKAQASLPDKDIPSNLKRFISPSRVISPASRPFVVASYGSLSRTGAPTINYFTSKLRLSAKQLNALSYDAKRYGGNLYSVSGYDSFTTYSPPRTTTPRSPPTYSPPRTTTPRSPPTYSPPRTTTPRSPPTYSPPRTTTPRSPPTYSPPRITTPRLPPTLRPRRSNLLTKKYSVEVRRYGRFKRIGVAEQIEKAFKIGERAVRNTAAASFRVTSQTGRRVTPSSLPRGFRKSERELGVLIQRREYRIGTAGEKGEITYKGIQATRRRRRKRSIL